MKEYKQTTEFTGAAAALLMVINHYKPDFELSRENEFRIWLSSVDLPTRACSVYGLASFARRQGLVVEVYVGKQCYGYPDYRFKGYKKEEIEAATFTEDLHLRDLKELNIKIRGGEFSLDDVKELIFNNKIVMLRLDTGVFRSTKPSSNYVIVTNCGNFKFVIYDPYSGKIVVPEEKVKQSFEDLVLKRKRDHRMIVFG